MNITITGSLGNISKPLTEKLVKAGHKVKVISSTDRTADKIRELGASPAIGSINDLDFLVSAFSGADVIYTMTPNNFAEPDQRTYMAEVGKNYAAAIEKANVKNVVNLSSIGANLPNGTGPIKGLYEVEQVFERLTDVNIKHLRAAFFYTNFYNDIPLIKNLGITGSNYSEDTIMVLVHPLDIAIEIATQMEHGFKGKSVRYVYSDIQTSSNVAKTLGKAINKPDLTWVKFTNEQLLDGMLQAGLPAAVAKNYVEMGEAMGAGLLSNDFNQNTPTAGSTKLVDFAKEFAEKFNA